MFDISKLSPEEMLEYMKVINKAASTRRDDNDAQVLDIPRNWENPCALFMTISDLTDRGYNLELLRKNRISNLKQETTSYRDVDDLFLLVDSIAESFEDEGDKEFLERFADDVEENREFVQEDFNRFLELLADY